MKLILQTLLRRPFLRMRSEDIAMTVHCGTHMDAPLHFAHDKWSIDQIPITHFVNRPLAVVDVTKKVSKNPDYAVTVDDLLNWEEENGPLPEGGVVFLRTGFAKHYHSRVQYIGTTSSNHALVHTPGLSPEAAEWIVANRLIVGMGLDALSIDPGQGEQFMAHRTLFERNMFVIENLNSNIDKVPLTGAKVNLYPMSLEGASGAPTRVIVNTSFGHRLREPLGLLALAISFTLLGALV